MAVKIHDNDSKYQKLRKQLKKAKGKPHVAVGVLGQDGGKRHEDSVATIVDVASWNEFGTDTAPARSFLRSVYEQDVAKFLSIMRRVRMQVATGKMSIKDALELVGIYAQAQVQKKITDGGDPYIPNAARTIEKKGSSSPLIDTGQLRQSIRYEVRDGK